MEYVKFEKLSLEKHPELNEKWVQDRIAEDPSILGLGEDVYLKDGNHTLMPEIKKLSGNNRTDGKRRSGRNEL